MLPSTRLRRLRTIKVEVCFSYCRIDIVSFLLHTELILWYSQFIILNLLDAGGRI